MSTQSIILKNNVSANLALNEMNRNNKALKKSMEQLGTGEKITSTGDDASSYTISESMRARAKSLEQDSRNTQNGSSMLKVAEGAISSTVDELKYLKGKAILSANDTNTDADRAVIQKEVDQIIDQIDDNAQVSYNGKALVDGSHDGNDPARDNSLVFHVGVNPGENVHVTLDDMRADALTHTHVDYNEDGSIKSTETWKLSDLRVNTKDSAKKAIELLDGVLEKVLDQQTSLGAVQQRMEYTSNMLDISFRNESSAESVIRDADMADTALAMATNSILTNASNSMLAQANNKNAGVINMLNAMQQ